MSEELQMRQQFLQDDLKRVVTPIDLSKLENSCVLITGASGFMGIWMTELFTYLRREQQLNVKLLLLATDFGYARKTAPHLYESDQNTIIQDDIRSVHELPANVNWIIHAAASPDLRVHNSQPIHASRTIAQGTQTILECASRLPALRGFLNVSSGYVYGYHSEDEAVTGRRFEGFDPNSFSTVYVEAKRYAESLCAIYRNQYRMPILNVRPFSFVGPYQPIDAPWAVNNFIGNVTSKQPIRIQGDGTAVRSYMYGADMAWWLLNLLISGEPGASYNLGSPEGISLLNLAEKIRTLAASDVAINKGQPMLNSRKSYFVPNVDEVEREFGLELRFGLDDALARTIRWHNQIRA